jgi:hypothetical protein
MAKIETLRQLMGHQRKGTLPAEFANQNVDIEAALRDEMKKLVGNYNLYRRNKLDLFELLQESIDEVVPNKVDAILGKFAEVRNFKQGQKAVFKIRLGRLRAKQFVTRVAPSGVYETFRLDSKEITLEPEAHGGAVMIDFERYLDGQEDMMEVYEILTDGLVDVTYGLIQAALMESWNALGRPSNTKKSVSGFDQAEMDSLIAVASAYGSPIIYCTKEFAALMSNAITYATGTGTTQRAYSEADLMDIRNQGYIGVYKGTPMVILPQSFVDETNAKRVINPRIAYVIPAGKERIVKVAYEGQTIVEDYKNRDNSMEIQAYKKLAVGIVSTPNSWCMYQNTAITASEFDTLS